MKTLIVFSTTHGCTAKAASELKGYIGSDATLVNLKENPNPEVKP